MTEGRLRSAGGYRHAESITCGSVRSFAVTAIRRRSSTLQREVDLGCDRFLRLCAANVHYERVPDVQPLRRYVPRRQPIDPRIVTSGNSTPLGPRLSPLDDAPPQIAMPVAGIRLGLRQASVLSTACRGWLALQVPKRSCIWEDPSVEIDNYCSAVEIACAMLRHPSDDGYRLRTVWELIRGAGEVGEVAVDLIADEPPLVGDRKFDALLAAAVEYIAAQAEVPAPPWTGKPCRFLDEEWWVSDLPSGRRYARLATPAAFRRRGIWLDEHDLSSA